MSQTPADITVSLNVADSWPYFSLLSATFHYLYSDKSPQFGRKVEYTAFSPSIDQYLHRDKPAREAIEQALCMIMYHVQGACNVHSAIHYNTPCFRNVLPQGGNHQDTIVTY